MKNFPSKFLKPHNNFYQTVTKLPWIHIATIRIYIQSKFGLYEFNRSWNSGSSLNLANYFGLLDHKLYYFLYLIRFFVKLCYFDHDLWNFLFKIGLSLFGFSAFYENFIFVKYSFVLLNFQFNIFCLMFITNFDVDLKSGSWTLEVTLREFSSETKF